MLILYDDEGMDESSKGNINLIQHFSLLLSVWREILLKVDTELTEPAE